MALADFRNAGKLDVFTDSQGAISVLLNAGSRKFVQAVSTQIGVPAGCGVTADFNRDGKPDVAVNTSTGIQILLGTGKTSKLFNVGQSLKLSGAGCLTQAKDLNKDGIPDLVITSPQGVVTYLGNGDGTFTEKSTTVTNGVGTNVVLGDFNRDGKLDFVTEGNQLALGNGDGTFQAPVQYIPNPPVTGFANVTVGDINNDGWPDVVLSNAYFPVATVYALLNNHHGGFTLAWQSGDDGLQPQLADLNGDGKLDLVLDLNVYVGNGKGQFTKKFTLPDGQGNGYPIASIVADLNGDGIPDITVIGPGDAAIFPGNGDATYGAPVYWGTGPSPSSLFPANLHGQKASAGLPDLVAPDGTAEVAVLLNLTTN